MSNALVEFSNQMVELVASIQNRVVAVETGGRMPASGVVWREEVVVTTDHSLKRHDEVELSLPDQSKLRAKVEARDPGSDLALLRVPNLKAPPPLPAASVKPGQLAIVIGRGAESGVHASMGMVSAVSGEWRTWRGGRLEQYLRLDVGQYVTTSGALVLTAASGVVGVASTALSRVAPLAVPAAAVDRIVAQLLEKGAVSRGYLGVGLQPVPLPERLGLSQDAALIVLTVEPESPAHRAGILLGDVIISLGGKSVREPADVLAILDTESVGQTVNAEIWRAGDRHSLAITVAERPSA